MILEKWYNFGDAVTDNEESGVADLGYKRLNRPVIETSIDKAWRFSTYFFHTLIKQRPSYLSCRASIKAGTTVSAF
jgi:hypothetical protein